MPVYVKIMVCLLVLPMLICNKRNLILAKELRAFHLTGRAQGTTWLVTYFATDSLITTQQVDSLFHSIDSSLSTYKSYSTITAFNKHPRGILMDHHFKNVIETALHIGKITDGLSDITVAPLVAAWGFGPNKRTTPPNEQELNQILECVGSQYIYIEKDSLLKTKPCVQIDVNGIAQGYTVDVISGFVEKNNIQNYIVEVGGEVKVKGKKQPLNQPFRIGIESPSSDDFSEAPMQMFVSMQNGAMTTSGNYRQYYESDGANITHVIHPKTGKPQHNELISATVFAKDGITADALDNALLLMGLENAIRFVDSTGNMAAFFVYKKPDGNIADTMTRSFIPLVDKQTY